MKLEILQENLTKKLGSVTRIIPSKPQLPILSHVLLSAKNNHLTLTSSNLETTIIISLGAKIESEGEFTVPARTLSELVASLPPGKITLQVKQSLLEITISQFHGQINGSPAAEFPPNPTDDLHSVWKVNAAGLFQALGQTMFSSATDESRAVLTGVLFKFDSDFVTLAATDGFRLSVVKVSKSSDLPEGQSQVIIPTRTLVEITKLLNDENPDQITINFLKSNQVLFSLSDTKIYSQLIAGNFPNFEKIIPAESSVRIKIPSEELLKGIRLAAIFARDSANIVKLKIAGSKLKIMANAAQVGENESEIDIEVDKGSGEDFQIAFNFRYLLDFLTSLGSKAADVTIDFTTPLAPGVFHLPSDKNFLHLIMPVRVQG
ncbi:MAG: polymerase III subunit beta protein [Microgenomates group bacterium GW2011_GWA1_48_10]|uniref:Beta sliding clamp n=1 Tax=Candidatus Gottesmanbacteria bacterium RIFCSPHIGHO2_01_FULL_47_48 TaxID=1798381 RepID=A0A1F6A4R7_9BACT|nr:MAG: polymerase III subunit beta protein [Microgenomates group bacterium GW2011_GWA1_48_10]OGG19653.1 MAG: DNA polymerase III subunit beta [Candidatus Gottesmanbacteria bacterium RIFCSPHIGHO2_01_FULL_47_48]